MQYSIRDGDWTLDVDDRLMQQVRAGLSDAGREIAARIEREIEDIYRTAHDLWPVKTGRSRASLTRRVTISTDGTIEGTVRAGAPYARYIQSWQISVRTQRHNEGTIQRLRERGVADPQRQRARSRQLIQELGKAGTQAARSGSAMWILLRWPEKRAAVRVEQDLRPLIEAALFREVSR